MTLSNATVTVISVVEDDDGLGNTTEERTETVLAWALVAPRTSVERVDPRAPGVVTAGAVWGPFGTPINSNDLIVIADHSPSMNGEWQAEGNSGDWSLGATEFGFELAIKRVP